MSEKRFVACDKWADSEGNIFKFVVIDTKILGDKQFVLRCNHWSQAQDICNRLNDTLDELREENEQLRQQAQNAKEIAVKNDMQYQICRKEKEDFQDMCEQLRKELDNFKPVIFQDMRKGTVILYSKGDTDV